MANYTKTTDFAAKDTLPGGDTNKVVRGAEFETEFDAISTAIATKSDTASPTFTGTVTIPTVDINAGAIDGATIGANSAAAGTFTNLTATTADINGGTIDGATIGGTTAGAGTFTDITATGTISFAGATFSDIGTVTTADINGGTIDGVTIGGSSAGAGTFTSLSTTSLSVGGSSVLTSVSFSDLDADAVTTSSETFADSDTQIPTNAAVIDYVAATVPTLAEVNDLTANVTWANVPDANITESSVTQHEAALSIAATQLTGNITVPGNVYLAPSGTGFTELRGNTNAGAIRFNCEVNSHGVTLKGPPHSAGATYSLELPDADGTDGQLIATDGSGKLSFATVSVEKATQTKTYTNGESSTITLSSAITSGVPVVSVTKEVPQTGVTNNRWDVDSTAENYTRYNSAPATTLDFVGFGISTASFVDSFSVGSQELTPEGIAFNTDGTKMFVVGRDGDDVNEYNLSTGFDVSTASYSQNFSVSSQDGSPHGIAFNSDGTKMFIVGNDGQDVNEYTLSTGFDVSTASYSQNFSISSEETDPTDISFNNDGTKMFIVGRNGDEVNEYDLSTGFDVSTASYSQNFSVSGQGTDPSGIAFNNDGTKMFISDFSDDEVNEYTLSTGFDVSTASFSQNFSVLAQENSPRAIAFSASGDKMFIVGNTGNDVNEYALSFNFSLGTGSFASADVGKTIEANGGTFILTSTGGAFTQTSAPTSFDQVASGSWEMYAIVYNTTDGDLELSAFDTAFNLTFASYSSKSYSVASQESTALGFTFGDSGSKFYITGFDNKTVYQYNLSTPYDVSTASYASKSLNVSARFSNPRGLAFNPDGTVLFVNGYGNFDIETFTLSTPFDVSTGSATTTSFSYSSQDERPRDLHFSPDGTTLIVSLDGNIYQYDLSTGFDITTASYSGNSITTDFLTSVSASTDGLTLLIGNGTNDQVDEYALSSAFDISTKTFVRSFDVSSQNGSLESLVFNDGGSKFFILGDNDTIYEYSTGDPKIPSGYHAAHTTASTDSTYWIDINSMTADEAAGDGNVYYAVSTDDRTTWKIAKGTDGERSIVRNNLGTWQYNSNGTYGSETWANATTNAELPALAEAMEGASFLGTGYVLDNSPSYDSSSFSIATEDGSPVGLAFNSDGTKMFMLGDANDTVYEYDLSTGYDLSTASYSSTSFSVSSQDTACKDLAFNNDGTKMYVVGNDNNSVFEYDLSTGFDLSTASYGRSFSTATQETTPEAVAFNADGTKMFVLGNTGDDVNEYSLSTAFNVTTASYTTNFSVSTQNTSPRDIAFNADGTKMFMINVGNIYQYNLSTGFDLSTASYANISVSLSDVGGNAFAVAFGGSIEGTKMYVVGQTNDAVYQYTTAGTTYTNQMDKTQLDAVPDANQFTLGDDLDLAVIFNMSSGTTAPSSDGVSINYDANALNQGAVLGTDYNWDFPATDKVRITSLAAQNLKVRIV